MRFNRQGSWHELCAVLAIFSGFWFATGSFAELGTGWPAPIGKNGPFTGVFCMDSSSTYCDEWDGNCHQPGGSWGADLFDCPGGKTGKCLVLTRKGSWGSCNNGSGSCTWYDEYPCVEYAVREKDCDGGLCPGDEYCKIFWFTLEGACDPQVATPGVPGGYRKLRR